MRLFKSSSNPVKCFVCISVLFIINIITEVTEFYEAKYIAVIFYGFFTKSEWGSKHHELPLDELK